MLVKKYKYNAPIHLELILQHLNEFKEELISEKESEIC